MFSLVDDIESYPEFLPWCRNAIVHWRDGERLEATLELYRGDLSKTFRTRNTSSGCESIEMSLVDGPFRQLAGTWTFRQLGKSGSKVTLNVAFEFASPVVDTMFGAFFEDVCNSLVDAFTRRADMEFAGAE